jgi:hypothetical protein
MLNQSTTGVGGLGVGQPLPEGQEASQYDDWSRQLQGNLEVLKSQLSALAIQLAPVRLHTPPNAEKPLPPQVEPMASPLVSFLRDQARHVSLLIQVIEQLRREIQL